MATPLLTRGLVVSTLFVALAAGCSGGGDADAPGNGTDPPGDDPHNCGAAELATPRLRLLTRREYNQTVQDWLGAWVGGAPMGTTCSVDADCNIIEASCVGGTCQADPCGLVTFVYPAAGQTYGSVHIAGSFNGWPGTVSEGGWAMTYVPSLDSWVSKRTVEEGTHLYKLVLDESTWISDPGNPDGEPDGFGGQNSRLALTCNGTPPGGTAGIPSDPAAAFPVESRPSHYPFDNSASQIATSVHVEQYMRAGAEIATAATVSLDWLPCTEQNDACARTIASELGRGAFRRPLTDDEVARYAALITAQPQWEDGLRVALRVMLNSPSFLYRSEVGEPQADGTTRLDAFEMASLLSYSFWGTMPDAELIRAASDGGLDDAEGVATQARRLLDDPRARPVLARFAQQWLGVERALNATRNPNLFPDFDAALATAMVEETGRFFTEVVYEGSGRFDELLLSDRTSAEGALATLYGAQEGRLPESRHAGLLGHASVLTSYALPDQTSPILRGLFVRERLLCQTLPTPPAQIPQLPEISEDATTRERFAQHSSDPVCASCHQFIDGLGFAFEGFDAIGARRDAEAGQSIDESGDTVDLELAGDLSASVSFEGLPGLAQVLVESPSAQACFVKQTYRYAFGALEEDGDACEVAALGAAFADGDRDIRSLLVALTQLERFTRRRPAQEEE